MTKARTARPEDLDWTQFTGSLPLTGVVRPQGKRKATLAARVVKAAKGAKVRHPA